MKCKDCERYKERIAIMIHEGGLDSQDAAKAARQDVCVGCDGERGVGLFDREGK